MPLVTSPSPAGSLAFMLLANADWWMGGANTRLVPRGHIRLVENPCASPERGQVRGALIPRIRRLVIVSTSVRHFRREKKTGSQDDQFHTSSIFSPLTLELNHSYISTSACVALAPSRTLVLAMRSVANCNSMVAKFLAIQARLPAPKANQ